jgi:predicted ABC-type ATPase
VVERTPCIWVLAGTNGAGKSSIAGAMLRESGGDYFNPDEVAKELQTRNPKLDQVEANALAWKLGVAQLDRAIREKLDYFFETTLGGKTIAKKLELAMKSRHHVRIWYASLASPEAHLARVAARVRAGGHDIPEADVRRRFDQSRINLIALLPRLAELKLYDNSVDGDPKSGRAPAPKLVLHMREGKIIAPRNLSKTPAWAKPIVAAALKRAAT